MASGATAAMVVDFRSVIEERMNAKRDELGQVQETLKRLGAGPGAAGRGRQGSGGLLRNRLGPAVTGLAAGAPQEHRRPLLNSRLGPRVVVVANPEAVSTKIEPSTVGETEAGGVLSRIVVERKSREDALAEQKVDRNETMRNKRMFGSILGTLQKFRADENKVKDRELKKRQIEKKIELKTEKEREDAKREKRELIENRWKGQRELKVLQLQMTRVEEFEAWERNKRQEQRYIKTKTGHNDVYYLPKEHNDSTMSALESTMEYIDREIMAARQAFEDELSKLNAKAEDPNVNLDDLEQQDSDAEEEAEPAFNVASLVSTVHKRDNARNEGQAPGAAADRTLGAPATSRSSSAKVQKADDDAPPPPPPTSNRNEEPSSSLVDASRKVKRATTRPEESGQDSQRPVVRKDNDRVVKRGSGSKSPPVVADAPQPAGREKIKGVEEESVENKRSRSREGDVRKDPRSKKTRKRKASSSSDSSSSSASSSSSSSSASSSSSSSDDSSSSSDSDKEEADAKDKRAEDKAVKAKNDSSRQKRHRTERFENGK